MAHIILQKVLFIVILMLMVHNHCTLGSNCLSSMTVIRSPGNFSAILNFVLALYIVLCVAIKMGGKRSMH